MRFERQNNGGAAPAPGVLNNAAQKSLVAQVDPVEVSHGQDRRGNRKQSIVYVTVNLRDFLGRHQAISTQHPASLSGLYLLTDC